MKRLDAIIIGAGQAGLAMSHLLSSAGLDHVVLERFRIAERWRSERWDSLKLLTPNWFARLPGYRYAGDMPHGYMSMAEMTDYLTGYARVSSAPVIEFAPVTSLRQIDGGFESETHAGRIESRTVILATGACDQPVIPDCGKRITPSVAQIHSRDYRSPNALAPGGVLVVGASASGLQIARELARAGRRVTVAVGRHNSVPRRYRGLDIIDLMDRAGVFDDKIRDAHDPERSRHQPSLQLVGDTEPLDLASLRGLGVRVLGRLADADGAKLRFADDLAERTRLAQVKRARLLDRLDPVADALGLAADPAARLSSVLSAHDTALDLHAERIGTVIWATGFRRSYPWLHLPVLSPDGDIVTLGGNTAVRGFYTLGMPFQRCRKSTFIDGVGGDAHALLPRILEHLGSGRMAA
ncbi:NAD(P)-binding domain-containing protein [Pseudoruegeria sp. HB172150]|uniref:NAD(P)-binding domain-containing protein n=1 Tax=Pseudoruegeria sp. HB172150 TaxID=2721164 RepID=UPI001555929F|nr:NAD(P)-binding domain-containing protein [Pseudoruegeria sp. HB172150]